MPALDPAQYKGNDLPLRTNVLAKNALIELRQKLKFVNTSQRAFGGVMDGKDYLVPRVSGAEASERDPGEQVTDTANTSDRIAIPTKEIEYSLKFGSSSYRGQPGKFARDFVQNGVNALLKGVEQRATRTLARNQLITSVFDAGAGIDYSLVQDMSEYLDNQSAPEEGRFLLLNHKAKKDIMADPNFAEYNTSGLAGVTSSGQSPKLYGYEPLFTGLTYNGKSGVTSLLNGALIADVNEVNISVDGVSVPGGLYPGDIIKFDSESMMIVSIDGGFSGGESIDDFTQADMTVKRAVLGSSVAIHADDAGGTLVDGNIGLSYQKNDLLHVFVDQEYPEGMKPKAIEKSRAVDPASGIELYVLKEHIPGYNGAVRFTMSTVFGCQTVRPEKTVSRIILPTS